MKHVYKMVDVLSPETKKKVASMVHNPENGFLLSLSDRYTMYTPLEDFLEPGNTLLHLGIRELSLVLAYDVNEETKESYLGVSFFKHLFDPLTPSVEGFTYVIGDPPILPRLTTMLGIFMELLTHKDVQEFGLSEETKALIEEIYPCSEMVIIQLLQNLAELESDETLTNHLPDVSHLQ